MSEVLPHTLVSLVSVGMALAFWLADRNSPTSRALALAMAMIGAAIALNIVVLELVRVPAQLASTFALAETAAICALLEWILRVRRTLPSRHLNVAGGDRILRGGQLSAVVYGVVSLALPEQREARFLGQLSSVDASLDWFFWVFFAPIVLSALCAVAGLLLLLRRKPDRPEQLRVLAMAVAIPFFTSSFVIPLEFSAIGMILGQMIFLIGAVQYHVLQGQRGQFMAQFLSPHVAQMVRERGLTAAMQEQFVEISIVYADLRGYTAVSEGMSSGRLIGVLRDYYDTVGRVVAEFGGTVKDQAGDGVLILVGAPLPVPDHARRAIAMARQLREAVALLARGWEQQGIWLGLGIGVASGHVTAGIIGHRTRLEYSAVGASVNLAARLCQQATDGEILVAERSIELAGMPSAGHGLEVRAPLELKGFTGKVTHFALPATEAAKPAA